MSPPATRTDDSLTAEDINVKEMPMPTDSQEMLEGFAAENEGNFANLNEESSSSIPVTSNQTEGWYKRYCRWIPSSFDMLDNAEKKVLSYVKTKYDGLYVDITNPNLAEGSKCRWSFWGKPEEKKIWTLAFNKQSQSNEDQTDNGSGKVPMLLVHGLCAASGLWALNIDELAKDRQVYAIDLIGFGKSSRPKFSSDPSEAELQHVEAIEAWREKMGLEKFVLVGHSMGGFISASYALKYPDRVAHLVLADPWGFPEKPETVELPVKRTLAIKAVTTIGQYINPLALVRAAGPYGPGLISKYRPDLVNKYKDLDGNGNENVAAEYIYHSNANNPTGETAFRTMMNFFGWARNPMCHRLPELKPEIPLTLLYGENTWLRQIPEEEVKKCRPANSHTEVHIVPKAGHHVYADGVTFFNTVLNQAASLADQLFRQG